MWEPAIAPSGFLHIPLHSLSGPHHVTHRGFGRPKRYNHIPETKEPGMIRIAVDAANRFLPLSLSALRHHLFTAKE